MSNIVLSASEANVLSKQQKQFNNLVKNIEQAKQLLAKEIKKLDKLLDEYVQNVEPLVKIVADKQFELIVHIDAYTNEYKLNAKNTARVKEILATIFNEVFLVNHKPTTEMIALYDKWNEKTYKEEFEEVVRGTKDFFKEQMEAHMGKDFKFDFGFDSFEGGHEEFEKFQQDFFAKLSQATAEHFEKNPQEKPKANARKKTAKQLAKEQQEEFANEFKVKNIRNIYISLAKLLHPDTETDATLKAEKEEVMKKVTAAYDKNDLLTLLQLEIEWVHKNNTHLHNLKDDVLKLYCDVLKEQLRALQLEKFGLRENPRYNSIFDNNMFGGKMIHPKNLKNELKNLNHNLTIVSTHILSAVSAKHKPYSFETLLNKLENDFSIYENDDEQFSIQDMMAMFS